LVSPGAPALGKNKTLMMSETALRTVKTRVTVSDATRAVSRCTPEMHTREVTVVRISASRPTGTDKDAGEVGWGWAGGLDMVELGRTMKWEYAEAGLRFTCTRGPEVTLTSCTPRSCRTNQNIGIARKWR